MSASKAPRPICLGFQEAVNLFRILSIDRARTGLGSRLAYAPMPTLPPRKSDLNRVLCQLRGFGLAQENIKPLHVLIGSNKRCRQSSDCVPHVCTARLTHGDVYRIAEGLDCIAPAFAFVLAASCLTVPKLLELGYEFCGSYRKDPRTGETVFNVPPLMSASNVRSFLHGHKGIVGRRKACQAAPYLADGSASPRETKAAIMLALPQMLGGYAMGTPSMNFEVNATALARTIADRKSFRCDLCWPKAKLDVEYQSREFHEGEESRIKDSRRTNALMSMGFTVVGITNKELEDPGSTEVIVDTIAKALRKRRQTEPARYEFLKRELREELGLPV